MCLTFFFLVGLKWLTSELPNGFHLDHHGLNVAFTSVLGKWANKNVNTVMCVCYCEWVRQTKKDDKDVWEVTVHHTCPVSCVS